MMNEEMKWIQSITPKKYYQETVEVGIGDDAAIFSTDEKMENVIAVDTMVEQIHFTKDIMSPMGIGHKALAVNISDLAAMGAIPLYYLVSIAIPKKGWNNEELNLIYEGMTRLASKWKMDLIGGDTVSTESSLVMTVTVIGMVEKSTRLLRSNAQPNDVVFVTGKLGTVAYCLDQLMGRENRTDNKHLQKLKAYLEPTPQVEAGRILARSGMRIALNDVSDGLASEAKEIADASHVSIVIDWDKVPKESFIENEPVERQKDWVLYGGEDFQLVGTVSLENFQLLEQIFNKKGLHIFKIGTVGNESGQVFLQEGSNRKRKRLVRTGYDHLAMEEKK